MAFPIWPAAWRANLPAAGQAEANTRVGEIHGVQNPATQAAIATLQNNNWNLVHKLYNQAVDGGAQGAIDIYTVTGTVIVQVFGVGKVDLVGVGATVQLGVAGSTATLIALTDGPDITDGDIWVDATPDTQIEQLDFDGARTFIVSGGQNIIMTIATADLTAGEIDFYCYFKPISADGDVEAA